MNYQIDFLQRNQNIILHLSLIEGVGPASIIKIVEAVGVDILHNVYQFSLSDFIAIGFAEHKAQKIVTGLADKNLLEKELKLIEEHNVTVVTRWCLSYSPLLAEIHIPPVILYCQGNIALLRHEKTIACVGARKAHVYAHDVIKHVVSPLLHEGWVVVSGGAAGADTYAHQIALEANAGTIVVVGSGLCHQYPPSNKLLFKQVVEQQGLIVSCFSMNIRPDVTTFPARNRIISGLSHGCLVVQAASKSGALITAQQALDQGREVFVIPGSIFDPLSAGCHDLIQQGAKLTTCSQDILSEFEQFKSLKNNNDNHVQMKIDDIRPISRLQRKDPLEQAIVMILSIPMSFDHLLSKTKADMMDLQSALFNLSLEGIILQDGMGFWRLK